MVPGARGCQLIKMNKKIIFIIIAAILIGIIFIKIIKKQDIPIDYPVVGGDYEKINIIGESASSGVFDPSLEYNEDGTIGWMTYSPVEKWPKDVSTGIAKTTDNGKTWEKVIEVNTGEDGAILDNDMTIEGTWRNEVSTLIHDPTDPSPNKRWKLYWHKYFTKEPYGEDNRMVQYGWIAYKYAPDPSGPWSEEIALFGSGNFPLPPYTAMNNLNSLHSDLNKVIAYTEPGSLYKDGIIYLVLQSFELKKNKLFSKVLSISSIDHGKTWGYNGILLNDEDAGGFGYLRFAAPSLAEENGRVFLLVSPITKDDYYGTSIFEFDDISKGKLKRDRSGKLMLHKYLPPAIIANAGESDYDKYNTCGGIIMPQANPKDYPKIMNIYSTNQRITD